MAKTTTDTVQEYKALREEILRGDIKPFSTLQFDIKLIGIPAYEQ